MIASLQAVSLVCHPVAVALLVSCVGLSLDAGGSSAATPGATAPSQPPKAAAQPTAPVQPSPAAPAPLTQPIAPQIQETSLPPPIELPPPPAAAVPPDVPNRPLSAGEAALIALHHQPTVIEASAGISAARGRTQQARSGLLPLLAVTAGYSHVETLATET